MSLDAAAARASVVRAVRSSVARASAAHESCARAFRYSFDVVAAGALPACFQISVGVLFYARHACRRFTPPFYDAARFR